MQLYLIRHAQSQNNALWAATGTSNGRCADPLLTEMGIEQAHLLGRHLAQTPIEDDELDMTGYRLTHLYCSLMLRAVQTGTAVAKATGLPLHAWEPIHEWGGIFQEDAASKSRTGLPGPNRSYFAAHFPHLILPDHVDEAGWWNRPAEVHEQALQRIDSFIDALMQRHGGSDERVALITHGGFYNLFLRLLLAGPERTERLGVTFDLWYKVNNASITRIDIDERGISLAYQNRTTHLPPALITY